MEETALAVPTIDRLRKVASEAIDEANKAAAALKELGAEQAATHIARRMLRAARGPDSFRQVLIVLSQPRPNPAAEAAAKSHTFHFATREELVRLHAEGATGIQPWDADAHDKGCRCLLQLDGSALVGYTWVSTAPLVELKWGFHFNMPDDMAYNYNGFTTHPYRGTAYQGLRHLKLLELIAPQGKKRLFGFVDDLNYRSLRGTRKSGYLPVGLLSGWKRDGQTHFSVSVQHPAWAERVRMGPSQRQDAEAARAKIVA